MIRQSAAALLAAIALPAVAQTTGGSTSSPATTAGANAAAAGRITDAPAATAATYDADMAAYRVALRLHHRQVAADDASYVQRERAYADAMSAWRRQVYACDHGSDRACNAPTPDPADYM